MLNDLESIVNAIKSVWVQVIFLFGAVFSIIKAHLLLNRIRRIMFDQNDQLKLTTKEEFSGFCVLQETRQDEIINSFSKKIDEHNKRTSEIIFEMQRIHERHIEKLYEKMDYITDLIIKGK